MIGKMYVVTHKVAAIPNVAGYIPILVGADLHPEITQYTVRDNYGNNISRKNPNYCELTAIYWIWKNAPSDIIGLSHYRRYFSRTILSRNPKFFLKMEDADRILEKKRIILPKVRYSSSSIICAINRAPNMSDVKEMFDAIKECFPGYVEDYIWYLKQNRAHLYNMFVMKWEDFNDYCKWLFEILEYIEERHDMSLETDNYRLRLYGFLSERLISVWVHHNIPDTDICFCSVINTEENGFTRIKHCFGNCKREIEYFLFKNSKKELDLNDNLMKYILK